MNRTFLIIVLLVSGVALLLVVKAMQQGRSLVLLPSELIESSADRDLSRVRVAGRVAALPVEYRAEPPVGLKFSIHDPGTTSEKVVSVVYAGLKPDMFAPGRDVIIDGAFSAGVLQASKLLTQCPSKYEPPDPVKYMQERGE